MKSFYEFFIGYLGDQPAIAVAYGLAVIFMFLPGQMALNLTAVISISFRPEAYKRIFYKTLWFVAGKVTGYITLALISLELKDPTREFLDATHLFRDLFLSQITH